MQRSPTLGGSLGGSDSSETSAAGGSRGRSSWRAYMYVQQTVAARALSVTDAREPSMDAVVCKATSARYMYTTL